MFNRILIANRGEIACRVMRTARRMNIETVAVYSDADRGALHVELADHAVRIGGAAATDSYLRGDRIVEACLSSGAQAVHPGYGFLSENAAFCQMLDEQGIVFIGPPQGAIEVMGDKIRSKKLAQEAGVSTVPGYADVIRDAEHCVEIARGIGYPVMIKASAGGGGKGMRTVWNDAQCRQGFERATSEARSSFGDGRVFAEKMIIGPRHIEIQVLADDHGTTVHLGERECSIQRRHQKVIEEAPSPFMDPPTRAAMGAQAVALARAVDYRSAGTVEFIVDATRNFYFLEMNTRLQVEHPVTELVTGLDLVELMIRVAAGEALPFTQEEISTQGWAMEARVYAEDPSRDFVPSTGRLSRYRQPALSDEVRVDSGVREGSEMSMYYDPMIAKLVTYGNTRTKAIDRMLDALDAYYIRGVDHNVSFLAAVLDHPRFRAGDFSTGFLEEVYPQGFNPFVACGAASEAPADHGVVRVLQAVAAIVHLKVQSRDAEIGGENKSGDPIVQDSEWVVVSGAQRSAVRIVQSNEVFRISFEDEELEVLGAWAIGSPFFHGSVDGTPVWVQVERKGVGYCLFYRGRGLRCLVLRPRAAALQRLMPEKRVPDLSQFLLAPMPGLLVSVSVVVGDEVKSGQELAVVEAMKMENVLRAAHDGRVVAVVSEPGASLAVDQPILEFEL